MCQSEATPSAKIVGATRRVARRSAKDVGATQWVARKSPRKHVICDEILLAAKLSCPKCIVLDYNGTVSKEQKEALWARYSTLAPLRQQARQDRLLRVHAVFRLLEYTRLPAIHHRIGDLIAAMSRQAVHDDGIRIGVL